MDFQGLLPDDRVRRPRRGHGEDFNAEIVNLMYALEPSSLADLANSGI